MKNRVLFLFSKGVSHIGTRLFTFALSWYILSESGSGMDFSLSLLVNYLPQILLSLLAGHISGKARHPNRLLVLCDAASAAVCCLPLVHLSLISIYVTIFLLSAISAFFNNVIDTHLVHLEGVDSPKSLKRLTSAVQFITSGANIIAPSLGGLLIQVLPVQMFAVLNMASFLLSAFGELWLKYRPRQAGRPSQDKADSRAVLAYMFGSGKLRTFFLADSLGNFFVTAGQRGFALDRHHGPGHLCRRLWGDFQQHSGRVGAVRGVADEIPRYQPLTVPFRENGVPWGLHAASLPVGVPDWPSILVCDSALCHYVCHGVAVGRRQHTNENHPPAFCQTGLFRQSVWYIHGHFLCADSAVTCPCRRPIRNMACVCSAAGQWRDAHDGSCGFVGC